MPYYLKIDSSTILKQSIADSNTLPTEDKYEISSDVEPMRLLGLVRDEDNSTGHLKFTLADDQFIAGKNTWYVSKFHASIIEEVPRQPEVELVTNLERDRTDRGPQIQVPGVGSVHLYDPVGRSRDFYWYELARYGRRIPPTVECAQGMIRIAEMAQVGRDKVGKPFKITSGYRPHQINLEVGGVWNSRHTDPNGDALDFYWDGASKYEMYKFFDSWWTGGLGMYFHNSILHIDARPYRARWST
ncbi:MAG: D-Ala-D-Ala carboxypeptidase family metallohydrolase [Cyanobacteria bacterium J06598_3]